MKYNFISLKRYEIPRESTSTKEAFLEIVKEKAVIHSLNEIELASGLKTYDYVDMKSVLSNGQILTDAVELMMEPIKRNRMSFSCIGGPAMGAIPLATVVSVLNKCEWFAVRSSAKDRGTNKFIEGYRPERGDNVIIVDDVITTGSSVLKTYETILDESEGKILAVVALLDRGNVFTEVMAGLEIPYYPLFKYKDLEIDPI